MTNNTLDSGMALKGCPCCGGEAAWPEPEVGITWVECKSCGLSAGNECIWNTRHSSSPIELGERVREEAAKLFQEAVESGYPWPREKVELCEHGKFEWEDCIACYDEFLLERIAAIRSLDLSRVDP